MENWTCSKCKALNPPRRNKCWQCGNSRLDPTIVSVESTQPTHTIKRTVPPKKTQQRSKKLNPTVTVAIIGLIGTLIAAIAASPVLVALIQRTPIPSPSPNSSPTITTPIPSILPTETPSLTSPDLKIEYGFPFGGAGYGPNGASAYDPSGVLFLFILPARPTAVIPQTEAGDFERISSLAYNTITMSVTNQSSKTIILNNKIPIEVDRKALTTLVHVYDFSFFGGGGGYYRNFVSKIPADLGKQVVWAEFEVLDVDGLEPPINQPDFFTLAPSEIEVFQIEVLFVAPGDYTLRPGVEFSENGKAVRAWAPDVISASLPESMIVWSADESTGALVNGTCHFNHEVNWAEMTYDQLSSSLIFQAYTCDS